MVHICSPILPHTLKRRNQAYPSTTAHYLYQLPILAAIYGLCMHVGEVRLTCSQRGCYKIHINIQKALLPSWEHDTSFSEAFERVIAFKVGRQRRMN